MTNLLLDPPTRYSRPDNLRRFLGLKNLTLLEMLLQSPRLTKFIDKQVERMLGEVPALPSDERYLAEILLNLPEDKFQKIVRTVAIFTQAKAIQRTVSGSELNNIAQFYGDTNILHFIRDNDLPIFAGIKPCIVLNEASLQSYTTAAACFIFGFLPRNFQLRLILHRHQGQLNGSLECPNPEAREILKSLLRTALDFLGIHKQVGRLE